MLDVYKELFTTEKFTYETIFSPAIQMQINWDNDFIGIEEVAAQYENLKSVHGNIDYKIKDIFYQTPAIVSFSWEISAIHTGILLGFMPTNKPLKYQGTTILYTNNDKIEKIYTVFHKEKLKDNITVTPEKIFKPEEIFNDLTGPAKKIYELILSTRNKYTDSKQALVNALRNTTLVAPDLSLLNHREIAEIKEKTSSKTVKMDIGQREIDLLIYTPKGEEDNTKLPTILYLHGGGWCIGSPEVYDIPNRKLALTARARVVCPRYRLCPEHPFPAGFDDCCSVYVGIQALSDDNNLHINPKTVIVAGDSVGGGFAASLVLRMKDENKPLPNGVMLLSPATDIRLENYQSYNEYSRNNLMIDQGIIGFIRGAYIQGDLWDHPYVSPMRGDLSSFPKSLVMIGEDDPLYDENITFAEKVSQTSAHKCEILIGKGMPHHYHTFVGLADAVEEAYLKMALFVREIENSKLVN